VAVTWKAGHCLLLFPFGIPLCYSLVKIKEQLEDTSLWGGITWCKVFGSPRGEVLRMQRFAGRL